MELHPQTKQKSSSQSLGLFIFAATLTMLAGCSAAPTVSNDIVNDGKIVSKSFDAARDAARTPSKPVFVRDNGVYFTKQVINQRADDNKLNLPPSIYKKVTVNVPSSTDIRDIVARVSQITGVSIIINKDVFGEASSEQGGFGNNNKNTSSIGSSASAAPDSIGPSQSGQSTPLATPGGSASAGRAAQTAASTNEKDKPVTLSGLSYSGPVIGFLDAITSRLNIRWKWVNNHVELFVYDTRVYAVNILPGKTSNSSAVAGASLSESTDLWKDLEESLKGAVGKCEVCSVTALPSAGLVSVRATPTSFPLVEKIINDFTSSAGRQVMINIEIYTVTMSADDNYGFNWDALIKQLGSFDVCYLTAGAVAAVAGVSPVCGAAFPTSSLPAAGPGNVIGAVFNKPGNKLNTRGIVNALSTLGNTSLMTNASLVTLNGQPVPLDVTTQTAYLKSITTTAATATSAATTTLTPDVVNDGFVINMTPRISSTHDLLLQYSVNFTQLLDIVPFGASGSQIQLPEVTKRNFMQRANMKSGETLMLAGFKQNTNSKSDSGMGSPSFWFLGGVKKKAKDNQQMVILITPYILDNH